jgi:hypothetical protein
LEQNQIGKSEKQKKFKKSKKKIWVTHNILKMDSDDEEDIDEESDDYDIYKPAKIIKVDEKEGIVRIEVKYNSRVNNNNEQRRPVEEFV